MPEFGAYALYFFRREQTVQGGQNGLGEDRFGEDFHRGVKARIAPSPGGAISPLIAGMGRCG